jgi:2-oxoglutarate dehydrogenase E2 component (dihydrolipoamide succinyltransferase)
MPIEIRVPPLGESVVEATVGQWAKGEGDAVERDEVLVELETDKITVEVAAQSAGVLGKIEKQEGDVVGVNDLLGMLKEGGKGDDKSSMKAEAAPATPEPMAESDTTAEPETAASNKQGDAQTSPAARAIAAQNDIDLKSVRGTGPNERVTKQDATKAAEARTPESTPRKPQAEKSEPASATGAARPRDSETGSDRSDETRERMSRRRQTIARRLIESQQTTASLTTFNEVDLSAVMELRKRRQDDFVKKHGIKLGFMSFFTKAVIGALRQFPYLNSEIQGDEVVLKEHYDIGIAVGTDEGLVVPVIRGADKMSFAAIEHAISDVAKRARDGKLSLDDLQGGTFTITNGGIYGSMLSTPILNPPQVGILGMHNIVERPTAVDRKVEIRPIMYIALTYDHRIVDGSVAVQFLVAIKRMIEDPETMLIEG